MAEPAKDQAEPRVEDPKVHRDRHVKLHRALDELLADFVTHNPDKSLLKSTLLELLEWSHRQTIETTPTPGVTQLQ
jgi:hypothetical protein